MRGLLAGAGAGIALPAAASDLLSGGLAGEAVSGSEAKVASKASEAWHPVFLDDHQNATLIVLGERIAPGSSKAQVNRFIDLLLSVLPADAPQGFRTGDNHPQFTVEVRAPARQRLLDALGAFDREARKRFSAPFKDLS
ncbi:MAG: gluconate 2-dehydrogenase subunit 3 family protein, partial [Terriglobia bacterium]